MFNDYWHVWLILVLLGSTGLLHILILKWEYAFGTRGWWIYLMLGVACIIYTFFTPITLLKASLIIIGTNLLWSVHELFKQYDRVKKGWFPSGHGHKLEKARRNMNK